MGTLSIQVTNKHMTFGTESVASEKAHFSQTCRTLVENFLKFSGNFIGISPELPEVSLKFHRIFSECFREVSLKFPRNFLAQFLKTSMRYVCMSCVQERTRKSRACRMFKARVFSTRGAIGAATSAVHRASWTQDASRIVRGSLRPSRQASC